MNIVDTRLQVTNTTELADVLFVSDLPQQPAPTPDAVTAAAGRVLASHDVAWCVCRVAQEAGDHPDCYQRRMRWCLDVAREYGAAVSAA